MFNRYNVRIGDVILTDTAKRGISDEAVVVDHDGEFGLFVNHKVIKSDSNLQLFVMYQTITRNLSEEERLRKLSADVQILEHL